MTNAIPASALVRVLPGVLGAGGSDLSLNAVFVDTNSAIPIDTVMGFANAADVADFFGPNSTEAALASIYFNGFIGATQVPGTLFFVQQPSGNVGAYVRGGDISALPLATLATYTGVLTVAIDGETVTSANVDLSAASSFSNAAAIIQSALQVVGGIFAGVGSQATNVLTIASVGSGTLHVGDTVTGAGVFGGTATVLSQTGGTTGGIGTYTVSTSGTATTGAVDVTSAATVTYDSVRGAFVVHSGTTGANSAIAFPTTDALTTNLLLTAAKGAVLSQGSAAMTPAEVMDMVVTQTQNWATFMTLTEVVLSVKEAFAAWVNAQGQRYTYVCQDSDVTPTESNDATGSFGRIIAADNGVVSIWAPEGDNTIAAFFCGAAASINFQETNGRITFAFKGQAGLVPGVTTQTVADNLIANGYNFYGAYATANQSFQEFQNGQISGDWLWADPYVNQIYFNSAMQTALMNFLLNVKSLPYTQKGFGLLRAALLPVITAFKNFGGIQAGVQLSAAQAAEVNNAAGIDIAGTLQNIGWYLQILDPGATVRAARGSPAMTLWYTDGGSIQKINLASIDVL